MSDSCGVEDSAYTPQRWNTAHAGLTPRQSPGLKASDVNNDIMTPERVARAFVAAINSRQVEALSELMTDDHVFVDSDGSKKTGRQTVGQAWAGYFSMVPDYRIFVEETLARGDTVVILGRAQGTFARKGGVKPETHWSVPVAWRAKIDGDRVSVWQVYVNPEVMARALERIGPP